MGKEIGLLILVLVMGVFLSTFTLVILEMGNIETVTSYFSDTFYFNDEKKEVFNDDIVFVEKNVEYEEKGGSKHKIVIKKKETFVDKVIEVVNKIVEIPKQIAFFNNVQDDYYSSNITVHAGERMMNYPVNSRDYYVPLTKEEKFAVYSKQLGVIDSKRMEVIENFTLTASTGFSNPLGADTFGVLRNSQIEIKRRLVMQSGETDHYKFVYTVKNNGGEYFKDKTKFNLNTGKIMVTPTLVDFDGDSDLDLVIGEQFGKLYYYENDNGFKKVNNAINSSFASVTVHGYGTGGMSNFKSSPTFADLDNDNDYDLILGTRQTYLGYYENIGTDLSPNWLEGNLFGFLNDTTPYDAGFADFDNDGDLDLVVANLYDMVYYENTGTVNNPAFGAGVSYTFGLGLVFRTVEITDFDLDGDYDILIGEDTSVTLVRNVGDINSASFSLDNNFSIDHGRMLESIDIDKFGMAVGDLDGGEKDLIIGNDGGTLTFYKKGQGVVEDLYFYEALLLDFYIGGENKSITYDAATDSFIASWKYLSYPASSITLSGDRQSVKHGIHGIDWYYPSRWYYDNKCNGVNYDNSEDMYWVDGELNGIDSFIPTITGEYTCGSIEYFNLTPSVVLGYYLGNLSVGEEKTVTITYKYSIGDGGRSYADLSVGNVRFGENISFSIINNGQSSVVNPSVKLINIGDDGVNTLDYTYDSTIKEGSTVNVSLSFDVAKGNTLAVIVDPDDVINEYDENNNMIEVVKNEYNVYFDLEMGGLNSVFEEYLTSKLVNYNIVYDKADADYSIYLGGLEYNNQTLDKGWGMKGYAKWYGTKGFYPYNGFVNVLDDTIIVRGVNVDGVIAALKYVSWEALDKSKHYVSNGDPEGLKVFDYFRVPSNAGDLYKDNAVFEQTVHEALFGKYVEENKTVKTLQGVELRLRHLGSENSLLLKEYLNLSLYPVVMAGGLWSDISSWEELGQELSDDGRDVWLAEITGGPNTECDVCADYTYQEVVDYHIPAIVGGVVEYTNQTRIQWVGHSNAGRGGLDFLSAYSSSGMDPAGLYWDGDSWENSIFGTNVVETYVGAGVPGAFEELSYFGRIINQSGEEGIKSLSDKSKNHITFKEVAVELESPQLVRWLASSLSGDEKISLNLFTQYYNWMNSTEDPQPGLGLSVDNFLLFKGNFIENSDIIVPIIDEDSIFSQINSPNKTLVELYQVHFGMAENDKLKKNTISILNKE